MYIEPLVLQCMEWCDNFTLPFLVPLTTWLPSVHVPRVASLVIEEEITCAALVSTGQHVLLAMDNVVAMYHLATNRRVKVFRGGLGHLVLISRNTLYSLKK